ncbi:hypothetical protein PROFUN_11556 [Planoprotostelium fungivorum]|uniref:Uncharacterized protein n=1 Tax=Planoprotostelium fungivorum TaxID=1890364 RepID=A0A2P6N9I5_9EUKA|nr:hypothetical protein PROFUN_11556 [Planoprotostelium fungivorum]
MWLNLLSPLQPNLRLSPFWAQFANCDYNSCLRHATTVVLSREDVVSLQSTTSNKAVDFIRSSDSCHPFVAGVSTVLRS